MSATAPESPLRESRKRESDESKPSKTDRMRKHIVEFVTDCLDATTFDVAGKVGMSLKRAEIEMAQLAREGVLSEKITPGGGYFYSVTGKPLLPAEGNRPVDPVLKIAAGSC